MRDWLLMAGFPVGILKPPVSCELGLDRESEAFRKPARIGYAAGVVLWGLSGRSRAVPKRLDSWTVPGRFCVRCCTGPQSRMLPSMSFWHPGSPPQSA